MAQVPSRELRNQTRALLERVRAGEHITVTIDGRPVATLGPVTRHARWLSRTAFIDRVLTHQADPGLSAELAKLADETTDDLPFR
jgi:prevent-host-death family protein